MRSKFLAATALGSSILFMVPGAFAQSAFDWNGAYVGVTLGGLGSSGEVTTTEGDEFLLHGNGGLAGITLGYNYVLNENMVVGIEGDASLSLLDDSVGYPDYGASEKLDSLLSLRGRFGLTKGPLMAYATLGVAGGNASFSSDVSDFGKAFAPAEGSGFVAGVIGGGGIEVAVADNVSVKVEGLAYQLSSLSGAGNSDVEDEGKGGPYDATYNPSGLVIRGGVNLHF